jgi:hypothetical protein
MTPVTPPETIACYDEPGEVGMGINLDSEQSAAQSKSAGTVIIVYKGFIYLLDAGSQPNKDIQLSFDSAFSTSGMDLKFSGSAIILGKNLKAYLDMSGPKMPASLRLSNGADFTRTFDRCYTH